MSNRIRAEVLNDKANKLKEKGKLDEAIQLAQEAAELDPRSATPLYNLGLVFKNQRRWQESLEYNQRATKLDPKNQAAWWNLGIAATALGRWSVARAAWRGFGIDVPDGRGPIDLPCGCCPIRLNPEGDAEVVWADRLDPARARLVSIPFRNSGHRWGDIVLNDGEPIGSRRYKGQDVPVFNAIQLFEQSKFGTHVAEVHMPDKHRYLVELAEIADQLGGSAEDWTTSTRVLCKACSEGRIHKEHDTAAAPPDGVHLIAIAARDRKHASRILSTWEANRPEVKVESLEDSD